VTDSLKRASDAAMAAVMEMHEAELAAARARAKWTLALLELDAELAKEGAASK